MDYPYMNMMRPNEEDYKAKTITVNLYRYYEPFKHEDAYDRDPDEEEDEGRGSGAYQDNVNPPNGKEHWYSGYRHQPPNPQIKFDKLTLQDLINLLPEGVSAKDVKVTTSIDTGDMGIYGHEVIFYYKKKVKADPEGYKRDYAIWEKLQADWEVRKAAYDTFQKETEIKAKQKEIRDLKERLARLKK